MLLTIVRSAYETYLIRCEGFDRRNKSRRGHHKYIHETMLSTRTMLYCFLCILLYRWRSFDHHNWYSQRSCVCVFLCVAQTYRPPMYHDRYFSSHSCLSHLMFLSRLTDCCRLRLLTSGMCCVYITSIDHIAVEVSCCAPNWVRICHKIYIYIYIYRLIGSSPSYSWWYVLHYRTADHTFCQINTILYSIQNVLFIFTLNIGMCGCATGYAGIETIVFTTCQLDTKY